MRFGYLFSAVLIAALADRAAAAQLEVVTIQSVKLRGNPLGDPTTRRIAIFQPDKMLAESLPPLVVYLPGWGGSSEDAIAQGPHAWYGDVIDRLAAHGMHVRIAVVDGRSRYGGSQFLNSTATGDYADYVVDEIVPSLTKTQCIVAGHSSGGYGALMLAMSRHEKFTAVVALSPDSDFETTHKPLAEQAPVRAVTRADLDAAMAPAKSAHLPDDGLARLIMGLCANYTPTQGKPGRFDWLSTSAGRGARKPGSDGSRSIRSPSSGKRRTPLPPRSASTSTARSTMNSERTSAPQKSTRRCADGRRRHYFTSHPDTTPSTSSSGSHAASSGSQANRNRSGKPPRANCALDRPHSLPTLPRCTNRAPKPSPPFHSLHSTLFPAATSVLPMKKSRKCSKRSVPSRSMR